jgi:16S rRNA (adenine1518-N6/adenine1519-N6)-dimethyltransferase
MFLSAYCIINNNVINFIFILQPQVRKELINNSNKKLKPLKKFGQNYLQDKNILRKIVDEINPQLKDNLIEIGPGQGSLTKELFGKTELYTAVEIDSRVIEELRNNYEGLNLVHADFLKLELTNFGSFDNKIRIAGNIPYNLTSPIIFKLLENRAIVKDAILMIQLEVAQRIVSSIGTKDYGILSVILNAFADIKLCFKVSPNVFYPRPKVYSAVIHINFHNDKKDYDENLFKSIVKAAFNQRRKTLRNSLGNSIFANINFEQCPIDLGLRAEQLSINDFITLTNFIKQHQTHNQ